MTEQKPTVGRVVHFYDHNFMNPGPLAATISFVWDDETSVNLGILNPTGSAFNRQKVQYKTEGAKCYWEWPPRV